MQFDRTVRLIAMVVKGNSDQSDVNEHQGNDEVSPDAQIGETVEVLVDELQTDTPSASLRSRHYSGWVEPLQGNGYAVRKQQKRMSGRQHQGIVSSKDAGASRS